MLVLSGPRYPSSMDGTHMVCYLVVCSAFWHKICTYFCNKEETLNREYTTTVNTIWKVKFVLLKYHTLVDRTVNEITLIWKILSISFSFLSRQDFGWSESTAKKKKSASAHFSLLQFAWTHLWHNMHWIISWNDYLQQISQKQDTLPLCCSFLASGKFFTETELSQVPLFPLFFVLLQLRYIPTACKNWTLSVPFTFSPVGKPSIKEKAC